MNPASSASARKGTLQGLQVLRAVAAIMVLLTHSGFYASERLVKSYHYWQGGTAGVDIFFVLSGYVMIYSSQSLMKDKDGWKIFAERRFVRIVPIYWLATSIKLLTMLVVSKLILHAELSPLKTFCSYAFLPTYNVDHEFRPLLGVGWTLNFEMFFYFLFCIALAIRTNVIMFLGVILSMLTIGSYFVGSNGAPPTFYLNHIVLDFLWGMLIAQAYLNRRKVWSKWVPMAALVSGMIVLCIHHTFGFSLLLGLAAAAVVWGTVQLEPHLRMLPRWALYLGDASYVIYLFHPMVAPAAPAILFKLHLPSPIASIALSLAIALAVGCIVHQWVELPLTRALRDRLRIHGRKFIHPPATVENG